MVVKTVDIQVNSNLAQADQEAQALAKSLNKAETAAEGLNSETGASKNGATSIRSIKDAALELSPALKSTEGAMSGVLKQMWLIVANPIGAVIAAIVLGLTALFKAFQSTDEGADKLEQIMSGLGNVLTVIRDRVIKFAEAWMKFLSGDFKGALKDAKAAVNGFGDEMVAEFNKGAEAARLLQEVDDKMRQLGVTRAKLNRDLARSKELLSDENATYAEKKKAIEEIRKAESSYTEEALANARKRLKAAQLDRRLSADEREENIAKALEEVYNLEEESAAIQRQANRQQKQLNAQLAADQKAKHDAEMQRIKEREEARKKELESLRKIAEEAQQKETDSYNRILEAKKKNQDFNKTAQQIEIDDTTSKYDILIEQAKKFGQDTTDLEIEKLNALNDINLKYQQQSYDNEKANSDAKIKLAQAEAQAKIQAADAVSNTLNNAADLLGKTTGAGKALALVAATISMFSSAQKAYEATVGIPFVGPTLAPINAGLAIVAGLKNIQAINSVKVPGGGGGSAPSVSGVGGGVTPQFNVVGNSGVNQLANVIANKEQPPVRTYVVASDVTSAQSLDRNIVKSASLG